MYVQVTYLLASDDTVRREFGNLAAIKDNYPKFVVSMDPLSGGFGEYPESNMSIFGIFLKRILMSEKVPFHGATSPIYVR